MARIPSCRVLVMAIALGGCQVSVAPDGTTHGNEQAENENSSDDNTEANTNANDAGNDNEVPGNDNAGDSDNGNVDNGNGSGGTDSCGVITYGNFAEGFFTTYCTPCHSSQLSGAARNGAPSSRNFDTLGGVLEALDRIRVRATELNSMPPSSADAIPLSEERATLQSWIDCGATE